ncbi:hypothetical protein COV05_02200 [Candidatus Uhrbacteria bacterium CG10_big_fil_rev_8_21_14_0_10_48_16]|uniref:Uncharacterized protein n=1 Tax=Candidatus Uhrbacteria bacterium CG10_big_fil_rev_8_21_14_0_10_48_16 TaxID=1975038 RepID=A0A2M8LHR2_9BACT|nr:MAG: hypothetical protein COV05_02200 [Candidatus Uhrbacteria bacterium CG10_big_fil_rev_8_21_14_0_10_48_16]
MEHERRRIRPMPERFTKPAIAEGFQRAFDQIMTSDDPESAREEFMLRTRDSAKRFFRERQEHIAPILEQMDEMLRHKDERFSEELSEKLSALFEAMYRDPETAERFHEHLRQQEREDRERIVEHAKGVSLSPEGMLYGLLDAPDNTTFRIHVATALTLDFKEILVDFRQGMRELARLIQHDPAYKDVQKIAGTSWIVGEHPRVAERMGFHVDPDPLPPEDMVHFGGETRRVQNSWMTRDELIEKYGASETS